MNVAKMKEVLAVLKTEPTDHSFVTVDTLIDETPKCTVKSRTSGLPLDMTFPGHSKVMQLSRFYAQAGLNYFNNVNNKLKAKGLPSMERGERKWGTRLGDTMLIEHKNETYLELFASENANSEHSKHILMWEDGTRLTADEVANIKANFLPIKKGSSKQANAGLDREEQTVYLNIKLTNILRFKGYGVEMGEAVDM